MKCPKCNADTKEIEYQSIKVNRCTNCKGIWFDMLEAEDLKKISGSESIDIGNPETGKQFNKKENITCPKCNAQMVKMVDNEQPHLWFEKCPVCYGVWFDAGEFTDFKEEDKLDKIKDFLTKTRRE